MTKQQIIKELTDIRNEILYPDGVPLEFGCQIIAINDIETGERLHKNGGNSKKNEIKKGDILSFITKNRKTDVVVMSCGDNCFLPAYDVFRQNYKILGKPISLNDILRLIQENKQNKFFYCISTNGYFEVMDIDNNIILDDFSFKINLEKEIKDQKTETLEQLYSMIK